jgi:hypothetical protein
VRTAQRTFAGLQVEQDGADVVVRADALPGIHEALPRCCIERDAVLRGRIGQRVVRHHVEVFVHLHDRGGKGVAELLFTPGRHERVGLGRHRRCGLPERRDLEQRAEQVEDDGDGLHAPNFRPRDGDYFGRNAVSINVA